MVASAAFDSRSVASSLAACRSALREVNLPFAVFAAAAAFALVAAASEAAFAACLAASASA